MNIHNSTSHNPSNKTYFCQFMNLGNLKSKSKHIRRWEEILHYEESDWEVWLTLGKTDEYCQKAPVMDLSRSTGNKG